MKKLLQFKMTLLMYCILFFSVANAQNTPPVVNAGVDQLILLSDIATLSGSATDDGLVNPLSTTWSFVSGPGTVSFSNPSNLNSTATFSAPGTYFLRLRAQDGQYTRSDTVRVAVRVQITDRKCNMGNYVAYVSNVTQAEIINTANLSGVAGVHKRYKWKDLEPTPGNYNFSSIQTDLNILSSRGKQLISMVLTKSFDTNSVVTPNYLSSYVATFGPNFQGTYGYSIAIWDPFVVTRLKLLLDTLAKTFDTHPNFEGVATQETALGQPWNPSMASFGYTDEIYRDAMIDILTGASNSFRQSSIFWYMNFMPAPYPWKEDYLAEVAHAVAPLGTIRVGGPDVLPDDIGLQRRTYRLYDSLVGEVPLFCSIQNNSYRHLHEDTVNYSTKYWTLQEMVDFSRDSLYVNYLMWNYKTWKTPGQPDEYDFNDAKLVMAANPVHNPQLSNPLTAGSISGTNTVCKGQTNVSYSVPPIINATDYIWSYSGTGATISGTTNSVTINFSATATSGNLKVMGSNCCGNGTISTNYAITVTSNKTVSAASSTPTLCINSALTNITHTTTGATGIGAATGLPAGVTANWAANTITISGTPTVSGTFNYSIPLTGGCGTVSATGTITVTPNKTVTAASSSPIVCINTAIPSVTHTTTGATGIGAATGLPAGVTANWAGGIITISGTPTASGTFNYTIPLTGGCGTVNAIGTIIVNAPAAGIDVQTACNSYTWIDGNNYTASNSTATFNIVGGAANGCDSLVTLNLTVNSIDTSVTQNVNTLIANETGANYQWLDCNNSFTIINGATTQSYIVPINGNYAVEITKNTCVDTSSCVNVLVTGLNVLEETGMRIYPNPINNQFIIELTDYSVDTKITITSIEGKIVYSNTSIPSRKIVLNATDWAKGVYTIKLTNQQVNLTSKLIKQ
ncbi:MAG: T9SS type A sorting domain-containing protein [Bacteroidetes bacterium]|nr:T9SS type A sorting domain-containing protein [Bacteroidota bacterium]